MVKSRFLFALLLALSSTAALAQTGTVMPIPRIQIGDANNAPCSGCKLYAFESGSNTPLATYQNVTLTTTHDHPIVLDSAGRATVFLSNNTYRFRLDTAADVVIWTVDGVSATPVSSGNIDVTATAGESVASGDVVYLSDGSGSLTAGRWYKADADNTYSSSAAPMIGITTAAIASGSSGTVRIAGRVTGLSGLSSGSIYYVSATAGGMTSTIPSNSRFLGAADSTTTLILQSESQTGAPAIPDSDGSHSIVLKTTSNLTADRFFTIVPGDAARTLTVSADVTLDQTLATTSAPTFSWAGPCAGRLTATTAVPVTASDVSAATSIFWTPYQGNECYVYDGAATWTRLTFTELTLSVVGCTASTPYDVFVYSNSGVLAVESLIWTNATTRATALVLQNGRYVKTGQTTRRYVGSFYCNSTGGQTDDTLAKRYVYNAENRVARPMRVLESTASWTYGSTIRQANNSAANQLDIMVGLQEDALSVVALVVASSTSSGDSATVSIGQDGLTTASGSLAGSVGFTANLNEIILARFVLQPAIGRHYYPWLEAVGVGSVNFAGSSTFSGLVATWRN